MVQIYSKDYFLKPDEHFDLHGNSSQELWKPFNQQSSIKLFTFPPEKKYFWEIKCPTLS